MWRIALFLALLGAMIKYGKMYFLIAGYNTLTKQDQAKYNIEGIATLFRNVMFSLALILILSSLLAWAFDAPVIESIALLGVVPVGIVYLVIKSNSNRYKVNNKK